LGLRDALFGRTKLSEPHDDRLFALTTAAVTLQIELGLKTAGVGAISFKPQSSGEFRSAFDDIDKLTDAVAQSSGSQIERKTDQYGYDWVIVHDPDLEDLVTSVHGIATSPSRDSARSCLRRRSSSKAASTRSTGSTASSAARSGRSCRAGSRSATTRPSSS
jgi:hypothetical protein